MPYLPRKQEVTQSPDGSYLVKVLSPAREGKANKELIDLLANYFRIPKSRIEIISGAKSRSKIVEIYEE